MIGNLIPFLFSWFSFLLGIVFVASLVIYLLPIVITKLLPVPNLKKKFQTEWALVTGGSSGIGAELSLLLAKQKLNVVVVALDDEMLENHMQKLQKMFPDQKFIKVGVNLGKDGYLEVIEKAVQDLDIGLIFNNAGFITLGACTGAFPSFPLERHVQNIECNLMSYVKLTYFFYSKWKKLNAHPSTNKPRSICFTSSSAGYFIAPYTVTYGASKAFLTNFAYSLAVEALHNNVYVTCFHPQYTKTKLYEKSEKLQILDLLSVFGSDPDHVATNMIKSVGYGLKQRDQGIYSVMMRIVSGLLFDMNLLLPVVSFFLRFAPEYKKLK